MSYLIEFIIAREVLDSRGNPTIEVDVATEGGDTGRAAVPSGASTGTYEAVELRDCGERFHGKGLLQAIKAVEEEIAPKLLGMDVREQRRIDGVMIELDGTENKSRLGANSILGVSIACAKAGAKNTGHQLYEYLDRDAHTLPIPFFNVINGGAHAGNDLDFQEFMIAPVGANTFKEALRMGSETYQTLKNMLKARYGGNAIHVGDEGGFAPPISSPNEALNIILDAIGETGYGDEVKLALDVAASEFYEDGFYNLADGKKTREDLLDIYEELLDEYPIISIEDPLEEEDYIGFKMATEILDVQILGDDIFVTDTDRLGRGIEMRAADALLWKVNQIGTLSEALEAAEMAQRNNYKVMASHRSGDTEDTFVSDLAVAIDCGQIKAGAPARGERTCKYNRLLRIEERLGESAIYPNSL
ncbi:MAG: phosphopyruvate hydratase [Candidatus Bathyarchaeia archaeon]